MAHVRGHQTTSTAGMSRVEQNTGTPRNMAYEKQMADTYAKVRTGTGANDYGYTGIPNNQARGSGTPSSTTRSGGGGGFNLGGLLSSLGGAYAARQMAKIAEANRKWQTEQNTIAYERSLPWSSYGPAGNVEFDPETKEIMKTLAPEFQELMSGWLGVSGMAQQEMLSMMGDPYKMEREQFDRFERLNAPAYAQQRWAQKEQALARGMQGTESYYDQLAVEDAINQSRLGGQMQAMNTGMDYRQMLMAEALGFGRGGMDVAGMLDRDEELGIGAGQGSEVAANILGMAGAGTDLMDTQNAYYSGMLGQGSKYGGGASTIGGSGGTTPQGAAGNTGGGFFSMLSNLGSALFPQNTNTSSNYNYTR